MVQWSALVHSMHIMHLSTKVVFSSNMYNLDYDHKYMWMFLSENEYFTFIKAFNTNNHCNCFV